MLWWRNFNKCCINRVLKIIFVWGVLLGDKLFHKELRSWPMMMRIMETEFCWFHNPHVWSTTGCHKIDFVTQIWFVAYTAASNRVRSGHCSEYKYSVAIQGFDEILSWKF